MSPHGEELTFTDWITHEGGPNPVRGLCGDVLFADGDVLSGPFDKHASSRWEHDPTIFLSNHIVAYRISKK